MDRFKKYLLNKMLCLNLIPYVIWATGMTIQETSKESTIIDFTEKSHYESWRIVNDGVMGGLSESEMIAGDSASAIFQGNVSLENNGGFASVRTVPRSYDLKGFEGVEIRVRGDGKKYQFRIRVDNRFDGISYRNIFETNKGQWMIIRLPFNEFVPTFRGRILDEDPLSPDQIQQLGFLIADYQEGKFQLEIDWIKAYKGQGQ
jgi:monofunctional biosynthetic peptidoglycan transglycosylase